MVNLIKQKPRPLAKNKREITMKKVAIIGGGAIAKRLQARLEVEGEKVCFSLRRNHAGLSFGKLLAKHKPRAVFVAISTLDQGEAERDYLIASVETGIPAITCAKGALSHHAKTLKPYLEKIGFSAAVGGGTRMLHYLKGRHPNNQSMQIHVVLNGTLNFVFDEMHRGGRTLGEACGEAAKLGYAEPGATDPLSLINGELTDVARKTCVIFNTALSHREFLTPNMLGSFRQTSQGIRKLSEKGGDCRLVVSFSNRRFSTSPVFFGKGFKAKTEGWNISGGFRQVGNLSEFTSWLPGGVGNAIHIIEGELGKGGKYTLSGPGAGAEPTTTAMLQDYHELCP